MTRKKNDTRRPAYGVVYDDGTVERVPFDTSQDIVVEIEEAIDDSGDNRAHGFVDAVADLTHEKLDFEELLNVRLGSADERARRLSRRLLDECR